MLAWATSLARPDAWSFPVVVPDPSTEGLIWACGNGKVFKSLDGGNQWEESGTGLPASNFWIYGLVVSPSNPAELWLATSQGAYRSLDAGGTWTLTSSGITPARLQSLTLNPAEPSTLLGGDYLAIYRTTNSGDTWTKVHAFPAGSNSSVKALAMAPSAPSVVYAGTSDSGVLKSTDGGLSWEAANNGLGSLDVRSVRVDPTSPLTVYAATKDGFYRSLDGAQNWQGVSGGLSIRELLSLGLDPSDASRLYTGTLAGGAYSISFPCEAPVVTVVPHSPFCSGSAASLSVTVQGTPPFHYAWYQGPAGDTGTPAPRIPRRTAPFP